MNEVNVLKGQHRVALIQMQTRVSTQHWQQRLMRYNAAQSGNQWTRRVTGNAQWRNQLKFPDSKRRRGKRRRQKRSVGDV